LMTLVSMLRARAEQHTGYLKSDVFLWNVDSLNETLSIVSYQDLDSWNKWLEDKEREKIQNKIDDLGCVTRYEVFTDPPEDLLKVKPTVVY
jgi:hypothetical protein